MAIETPLPTLPLDPDLPASFDDTDNDERPIQQLDVWWDKPYLVTNGDGTYTARCLNGGAWDRSTMLAEGATIEEATALGLAAQERWVKFRRQPVSLYVDGETWDLVVMPQRPDQDMTVLQTGLSAEQATAYINGQME